MIKVITYGTFDLLHHGHIRLLERAKALGDYLIVGITTNDFDRNRGKINVQQTLVERIESVKSLGIADKIVIEEYEGQKIDDILRYNIDIFTVGSDWKGQFDYLDEYCKVIYLERTKGISSSELRCIKNKLRIGLIGNDNNLYQYYQESKEINGVEISGIYFGDSVLDAKTDMWQEIQVTDIDTLLDQSDAVYICSPPEMHYRYIKTALLKNKHILCESPIALKKRQCIELVEMARKNNLVLMEGIKTAYSTMFNRLYLLVKSGIIGKVLDIYVVCTETDEIQNMNDDNGYQNISDISRLGPIAMLPIFQLLGTDYKKNIITPIYLNTEQKIAFTKIDFRYSKATASIKIGHGIETERELVITGTLGYIYVPAIWWKSEYFEIRYRNPSQNKKYFWKQDDLKCQISTFLKMIEKNENNIYVNSDISISITEIVDKYMELI